MRSKPAVSVKQLGAYLQPMASQIASLSITLLHGWSTKIWLPERTDVVISEVVGNEPLDEGVIGIMQDALRRLAKPGARQVPGCIKILGLPVTIPDEELNKLTFTTQTLQNWRSWYDITFEPLAEVVRSSRFGSRFGYFTNPHRMRTREPLSDPVPLVDIEFTPGQTILRQTGAGSRPIASIPVPTL